MTGFTKAILLSVAAHILLATCLALYLNLVPVPDVPRLDLSAVEISFSEEPDTWPEAARTESAPPEEPKEPDTMQEAVRTESAPPEEPKVPDTMQEEPKVPDTMPKEVPDTMQEEVPDTKVEEAAPKQARVDAPPRPLKAIRPDYPKGARQRGEEGNVILELAIDTRGKVDSVTVVASSGHTELDAAAVHAARRARFAPAKSGRLPVFSTAQLTITFKLTPHE